MRCSEPTFRILNLMASSNPAPFPPHTPKCRVCPNSHAKSFLSQTLHNDSSGQMIQLWPDAAGLDAFDAHHRHPQMVNSSNVLCHFPSRNLLHTWTGVTIKLHAEGALKGFAHSVKLWSQRSLGRTHPHNLISSSSILSQRIALCGGLLCFHFQQMDVNLGGRVAIHIASFVLSKRRC